MDALHDARPDRFGLLRRPALLADGLTADEIDRLLRTGALRSVRRGVYRPASRPQDLPEEAHALRCRAALPELDPRAVFGHVSAAVLLRLPVVGVSLTRLHVVRDRSGHGQVRAGVHVHGSPLGSEDVVELDGLRVTSPARTAADLARSLPLEPALITVDGALQRGWRRSALGEDHPGATTVAEVVQALDRLARRHGIPAARRVLSLADERSESPGETRSRLAMHRAGLPKPATQWPVPGTGYRCDFAWPEHGVVGEFDGRVKYGRAARPGEDLREVLWREKRREDRIRATGLLVVRWTWSDITTAMAPRIRAALADRT